MIPTLWYWAPQFQFPFSGSVAQRIEPDFFSNIRDDTGNGTVRGEVEREAFEVASYGRQLGLISEVLLSLTSKDTVTRAKGEESLERLKVIYEKVEAVKARHKADDLETARLALEQLRQSDPESLALLVQRFAKPRPRVPAPARR